MKSIVTIAVILVACGCLLAYEPPLKEAIEIHKGEGDEQIVIRAEPRFAWAVSSVKWRGKEFINVTDHGRQLQAASNFDAGSKFTGETFNPTEAGSRWDGDKPSSTSRLLHATVGEDRFQTTTQMAFWLRPGERSSGELAKNKTALSNHLLTKRVQIGYRDIANVIVFDATFTTPVGEHHKYAQFEAVTGYMPNEFSHFWRYRPALKMIEPMPAGFGEQRFPVIAADATGDYAMGVYSQQQPSAGYETAGYGRFRFAEQRVNKWNCVFRKKGEIPPGEYRFVCYVLLGDLKLVAQNMEKLHRHFE